jgi:hypothetical protein
LDQKKQRSRTQHACEQNNDHDCAWKHQKTQQNAFRPRTKIEKAAWPLDQRQLRRGPSAFVQAEGWRQHGHNGSVQAYRLPSPAWNGTQSTVKGIAAIHTENARWQDDYAEGGKGSRASHADDPASGMAKLVRMCCARISVHFPFVTRSKRIGRGVFSAGVARFPRFVAPDYSHEKQRTRPSGNWR